jgi:putative tryptophan/tyrosine transport system substrate-binding protein
MRRREFILALGGASAAWPLASLVPVATLAQTNPKPALIGILHPGSSNDAPPIAALDALRAGLRALGHIEGQTYRLETRYSEDHQDRLPALASELVALRPDVIVAVADDAVRAAQAATAQIPIVMAMCTDDPVRAGRAASLARPSGNVTGFTGLVEELNAKQLELLHEFVPNLSDVAIMYNSASPSMTRERLDRVGEAAAALGLKTRLAGVARPQDLETMFKTLAGTTVGGLIVLPEPAVMDLNRGTIAEMALRLRLASVFTFRMYVVAGGLMSYAQDLLDMHRRSAAYVDKILKGVKPGDLAIEQPTKFELVINLKTAKALGLDIPPNLLARADEVIE